MIDATRSAEANRLYWETETPVAEIAERFDLSRRALYDVVSPFPAGAPCPTCGQGLHYENRSARRDGQAVCPECGAHTSLTAPDGPASEAMLEPIPAGSDMRADARAALPAADARAADLRGRAVVLGGAAIAGVAVGTIAALLARRRD